MVIKRALSAFLGGLLVISLLVSCSGERSFNHCELYITLPREFEDVGSSDSFDLLLSNGDVSIGIARMSFSAALNNGIADTLTDMAFAEFFIAQSGKQLTVYNRKGVPYVSYSEAHDGKEYYCMASFHRSLYAYFFVLYSTDYDKADTWREDFLNIATDVRFVYE